MPVLNFPNSAKTANGGAAPIDPPGGGGDDGGDMEDRVKRLEQLADKTGERLNLIERDLAVIKSNYSTKADVAEASNKIIMWVVGAFFLVQLLPAILKKFGL